MWIRVLLWILVLPGALVGVLAGFLLVGAVYGWEGSARLGRLHYVGSLRSPMPIGIAAAFVIFAYAVMALLWGRKEGRRVGLVAGYVEIAACLASMATELKAGRLYLPLDLLLVVPFLIKLHALKRKWEAEPNPSPLTAPEGGASA